MKTEESINLWDLVINVLLN